jgi:anthranilate phosphoribosyltransferase
MAHLLHHEDVAARCASAGLARARQFNWQSTARLVYAAYQHAVEQHGAGRTVTGSSR